VPAAPGKGRSPMNVAVVPTTRAIGPSSISARSTEWLIRSVVTP
jgi:hypothetical protein